MTDLPALESVRFVVQGPPRPKERPRLGRGGRVYTPERTKQYERAVAQQGALWCGPAWSRHGTYRVTLFFVFKSEPRCDVDNCAKAVLDALNGIAWDDDKQVVELRASKYAEDDATAKRYAGVESARPRTEALIERVGEWRGSKKGRRSKKAASFDDLIAIEDAIRKRKATKKSDSPLAYMGPSLLPPELRGTRIPVTYARERPLKLIETVIADIHARYPSRRIR